MFSRQNNIVLLKMKIALAQINPTIGDFAGNIVRILDGYRRASEAKADVVLFPELAITGYPPRDLLLRPHFIKENLRAIDRLAAQIQGPPLVIGYVDRNEEKVGRPLRNCAAFIEKDKAIRRIHKTLLPTYDVFDEDRYFEPSSEPSIPVTICGKKIGITICEDIWNDQDFWPSRIYRRDPVKELKAQGIDLLFNISASPWHLGKAEVRYRMIQTIAQNDQLPIFYCNMVGGNDELIFDGNSMAFDSKGNLLARAKGFDEDLVVVDLDAASPIPFRNEETCHGLFRALTLGLRDYVRKCGFKSVVMGLSGGIDSALTACIAVAALGKENVFGVAMPSQYSSEGSVADARILAQNLEIRFEIIPIQKQVETFGLSLAPIFEGLSTDTTEENLQSRIRGVTLMALSNKLGSLLITTGNKSELATGYCTLYGDMCGGLAVLSDLSKIQVYDLSRWINQHPELTSLKKEVIPEASLTKPPSAELRPNQTDQDTLPPYEVLDKILAGYIERHESVEDLIKQKFDPKIVRELTRKIDINEYKRRQAAPGLKVTSKAFGMGRRIPIAQRYREE
jgi:NAD+ synthase (glutamine-hydrolysing)